MNDSTKLTPQGSDKSIGNIIAEAKNLTPAQVDAVVSHQKSTGQKFGEAAVALGLAKNEDVIWALSQQFHYPYASDGALSVSSELVAATSPFDAPAEFFRDIRSQLITEVFNGKEPRCALAVCSADVGDGKTYFAANLAVAFSQLGHRTLLVDADMRKPRIQDVFGVGTSNNGLSSVLSGRAETNVIRPIDALPSLYVLPVGVTPPNPLELVQGIAFDLLLNELVSKFEYVIVDTPAATHGADAKVIAAKCGASVAICRQGITDAKAMRSLITTLDKSCAKFAGAIMNAHSGRS
ncbi:MAG: polysaccharide biosynthesis tyrosine autokinase [Aquabacterium sp.]